MANHSLPTFFKVLVNDFTRHLKLPPYLVLKHGNILPNYVKLRMSNGVTWDVKIRKTEDGYHDRVLSPQFELWLQDWQTPRLPLHKDFVKKAGLFGAKEVILEYVPTKRTLAVKVDNRSTATGGFKVELAFGWHYFQKGHGLKVGRTYSFTFNHARSVIQVQPVKNQTFHIAVVETDTSDSSGSDEN